MVLKRVRKPNLADLFLILFCISALVNCFLWGSLNREMPEPSADGWMRFAGFATKQPISSEYDCRNYSKAWSDRLGEIPIQHYIAIGRISDGRSHQYVLVAFDGLDRMPVTYNLTLDWLRKDEKWLNIDDKSFFKQLG